VCAGGNAAKSSTQPGAGFAAAIGDEAITMYRAELERLQYILHFPEEVSGDHRTQHFGTAGGIPIVCHRI
jgi:hypothetical protein